MAPNQPTLRYAGSVGVTITIKALPHDGRKRWPRLPCARRLGGALEPLAAASATGREGGGAGVGFHWPDPIKARGRYGAKADHAEAK